jgi:hypothetical protein
MKKIVVKSVDQSAELWEAGNLIKTYSISTAVNGLGCVADSLCTPFGTLRVAEKIGDGQAIGAVFKSRVPTGEIWKQGGNSFIITPEDDLILTRILRLEGLEGSNSNTFDRNIYLHGTNQEELLGKPVSHGCIRFSNRDILEIFDHLEIGCQVIVEPVPSLIR